MPHRCQQIKAKYRAKFQEQGYADDDDDDEDDDDEDEDPGPDVEGKSDEGKEAESGENNVAEDHEKYGRGGSDNLVLQNAPEGVEAYQKASAWYHVAYADTTNPFLADARKSWRGRSQETAVDGGVCGGRGGRGDVGGGFNEPHILYLSFPWICAHEKLCQIKEMALRNGS